MAAAADKNRKSAEGKDAPKKRSPLLITALVGLIAAGAAGAGVWFYVGKSHGAADKPAAPAKPAPAQYLALEPAFVVNLNGSFDGPRYLQLEVQLMTRDPIALVDLTTHVPAIRAHLLMLFSQVSAEQIADRAGREKLQAEALAEVQKLMTAETGKKAADEILFTSFVTQ